MTTPAMSSTASTADTGTKYTHLQETQIPSSLKFFMNNIKNIVHTPLTTDNHPLWRAQFIKVFQANGFYGFLDGSATAPQPYTITSDSVSTQNIEFAVWKLIDQNLTSALYSVITPSLLPYVLNLKTTQAVWITIEKRLQSTNRSRILQLKNGLHHIAMKEMTMTQYLSVIKSKVDAINAAGRSLDIEDIILYTLNGLPATYNVFKTSIRTNLQPLSLDDLYTLLCSEEINLTANTLRETHITAATDPPTALYTSRGRNQGRSSSMHSHPYNRGGQNTRRGGRIVNRSIECQICARRGHSTVNCWYRTDLEYQSPQNAALTATTNSSAADWYLDTGDSSHLTSDASQMSSVQPYLGQNQITVGNGQSLPIAATRQGSEEPFNSPSRSQP